MVDETANIYTFRFSIIFSSYQLCMSVADGFGTQFSVPFKIMISCPLLTSHNFLCDFAAPLRFWLPTILVICLSESRKEKACSTSRFRAILFPVSHSPKINTGIIDQLSITRRYRNCIPIRTKNSSHQSALFFTSPQTHI